MGVDSKISFKSKHMKCVPSLVSEIVLLMKISDSSRDTARKPASLS